MHPKVKPLYKYKWVWGAAFSSLLIFLAMQNMKFHEDRLRWNFPEEKRMQVWAQLEDSPVEKNKSILCEMKLLSTPSAQKRILDRRVQVYFPKDTLISSLLPGEKLLLNMRFTPVGQRNEPQGYLHYLRSNGIVATGYCADYTIIDDPEESSLSKAQSIAFSAAFGRPDQSVVASSNGKINVGSTDLWSPATLDKEILKDFSTTGVMHIISVSGFHVAIFCTFISFMLSAFPNTVGFRLIRFLFTITFLWGFVYVSGLSAPAVRAGLMLTFFLVGRLISRRADSYNILAASAFLMLVYNPWFLFDAGFQLSYIAVFFILYLQPRLNSLLTIRNPLLAAPRDWTSVTLAAQAGTTPLCLYVFGRFSLVFLFTNLPLAALSTLLIPLTVAWSLVSVGMGYPVWGQEIIELLCRWMLWIVTSFGRIPGASVSFSIGFGRCWSATAVSGFSFIT
jgi:ComEC/Rec2-related protein